MDLSHLSLDALLRKFRAFGFQVEFRDDRWVECWVGDHSGSWCGRGADQQAAFADAVRAMVPAQRIRELFLASLATESRTEPEAASSPATSPEPKPKPEFIPAGRIVGHVDLGTPAKHNEPTEPLRNDREQCQTELWRIQDDIRWAAAELGELAPRRMQLIFLIWISEARAIEANFPYDARIVEDVHQIARAIADHAKHYWPGSVPALNLESTPARSAQTLKLTPGSRAPSTWTALALRARETLRDDEAISQFDDTGWMDAAARTPTPNEPDQKLSELWKQVEELTGPLLEAKPARILDLDQPSELREGILHAARQLRWLRGTSSHPERWGRIFGRLRCLSMHHYRVFPELAGILNRKYAPIHPWAEILHHLAWPSGQKVEQAHASLRKAALPFTRGKRILYLSTRKDPALEIRLKDLLEAGSMEWSDLRDHPLNARDAYESLAQQVRTRNYDLVIAATGFLDPNDGHELAAACKSADLGYVRSARGDALACLRAVLRDLAGAPEGTVEGAAGLPSRS